MSLYSSKGKYTPGTSGREDKSQHHGEHAAAHDTGREQRENRNSEWRNALRDYDTYYEDSSIRREYQNPNPHRSQNWNMPGEDDAAQWEYQNFENQNGYSQNRSRPRTENRAQGNNAPGRNGAQQRRENPPHPKKKKKSGTWIYVLLSVILVAAMLTLLYTVRRVVLLRQEASTMEERAEQVHAIEESRPEYAQRPTVPVTQPPAEVPDIYSNSIAYREPGDFEHMLPQYSHLYAENNDMFGWLRIDDTRIDYPVMYTPEDPEKYLHTDFSGKNSFSGTPFLDGATSFDSDQLLIYAHNMKNGTMFRDLYKYENRDFWEEHPYIYLDTLYDQYTFEVMAVLYDKVYYKTDECFKFYQFIDADDQQKYEEAVGYYKEHALYDTGVTARYGDQLLCLVTCAYQTEDGRFLVVARKVNED